jgi:hypothetical protein
MLLKKIKLGIIDRCGQRGRKTGRNFKNRIGVEKSRERRRF